MKYNVRINAYLDNLGQAQALFNHASAIFDHMQTINPGAPTVQTSLITLEECHHDETPSKPCSVLDYLETPENSGP